MENTEEPCIICFEEKQEKILFDCNHSICLVCYSKILQNDNATCPICRQKIDNLVKVISKYIPIDNPPQPNPDNRATLNLRGILCFLTIIGSVIIILVVITNYK
jgi:hypothetical protein